MLLHLAFHTRALLILPDFLQRMSQQRMSFPCLRAISMAGKPTYMTSPGSPSILARIPDGLTIIPLLMRKVMSAGSMASRTRPTGRVSPSSMKLWETAQYALSAMWFLEAMILRKTSTLCEKRREKAYMYSNDILVPYDRKPCLVP